MEADSRRHMCATMRMFLAAVFTLLAGGHARAVEVILRLVRSDAPDKAVSTAIAHIDVDAERAKAKADAEAAAARAKNAGKSFAPKDQAGAAKAEFDRYSNYMRGIVVDHKIPFTKSYQGSYLGRSDTIKLNLEDGEHVVDPGGHKFAIQAGKISSSDPTLKANGATLDILLFPVGVIAVDGSFVRELPAEARRLPVAPRIYWGKEELLPKEENLGDGATFKRLTLYMIANSEGAGYRLSPSDVSFHVTEKGVAIVDVNGKSTTGGGVGIEDGFSIVLPKIKVPVTVSGNGVQVLILGPAGQLKLTSEPDMKFPRFFEMYPAPDGADITIGKRASNKPVHLSGDLGAYGRRRIAIDATSPESQEPRMIVAASPAFSANAGEALRMRLDCLDALDAPTLAPLQVAAFIARQPVLNDNGQLSEIPAEEAPLSEWRSLRVEGAPEPNLYDVVMPDLPSNVYRVRLVAGRRGECSPQSPLRADFIQAIINPAARTNLSVFSESGRHAFLNGSDMPVSVVVKSTVKVPAGKLSVVLRAAKSEGAGSEFALLEQEVPEREAGNYPLHFKLAGTATAALAPGEYMLTAKLGGIESNRWTVFIAQPRYLDSFNYFNNGWGGLSNIDSGSTYFNVPKSIGDANEKRGLLERNAEILGRMDTLNFGHGGFSPLAFYQGRDSSSEVAEVEQLLRKNLSLPAPEVYYYQNHYELMFEALARRGMAEMSCLIDPFSPRSLCHTVVTELNSKMRQFQLTAQIAKKFDNFAGMSLVMDDTTPTGDTEVGDNGRTIRLVQQMENFVAKYGAQPPAGSEMAKYLIAYRDGKVTPELAAPARIWEAWAVEENKLLGDFYGMGRAAVKPISAHLSYPIEGPGWGATWQGSYPVTAHKNQSPLTIDEGSGDYTMMMILNPLARTRFFHMTGNELWATIGDGNAPGFFNLKNHFAAYLAGGVTALGYYNGESVEANNPAQPKNMGLHKERQDIHAMLQAYGPMFKTIQPTADIGIFYPFHQTMYEVLHVDLGNGKMYNAMNASFSCICQLAMLGYNGEMVTEEMLDDPAANLSSARYKVMIVPALYYLLPRHLEALEKYVANGGTLLVGSHSTLIPKGARKIDGDDFFECVYADDQWTFNALLDTGHAWMFGEMHRKAPILKKALEPILKPFAQPATDRVLVQTSRAGAGRYTFVWDNLFPSWMGTTRVSGNADWSSQFGEANETTLVPVKERVSFPSRMHTYELFSQMPITPPRSTHSAKLSDDARDETIADLSFTPFRIFVSLPEPIASIKLELPESVQLGSHFKIKATPLDDGGKPIDAAVPLRITLKEEAADQVAQVSGVSMPVCEKELSAPLGRKPGKWTLVVDELISGRQIQSSLTILPAQTLPFGSSVQTLAGVDVQRPDLVRDFLEARKADGKTVLIVLGESQSKLKAAADEAAAALGSLGIKTEIKHTHQSGVFASGERVHLYKNWTELAPAQYIDHPIALLGGEGENTLIEELQENQLLLRPLSASYPGPGRGVVALVRSPFAYNYDALCLLGPDETGVKAAIAELKKIAAEKPAVAENKNAAPPGKLIEQTLPGSLHPGTRFATMDGAPVQSLTVSADGSRIGFGTLGYGKNIFVFDAAGKQLFEDKIGHVNTLGIVLPKDSQDTLVSSDGTSYLRAPDGKLLWRLKGILHADPELRYLVLPVGRTENGPAGFAVYDRSFKLLWKFDDWDSYQTTQEILFARQARFIAALDGGNTIAYHLTGKAPGLSEKFADDVVFCDALTGQEKRRIALSTEEIKSASGLLFTPPSQGGDGGSLDALKLYADGAFYIVNVESGRKSAPMLLDANLKPLQYERFKTPPYIGGLTTKTNEFLLADKRLVFTVGDTLCLTDPEWKTLTTYKTDNLIMSLSVDAARGRVAISNYSGHLTLLDYSQGAAPLDLRKVWQAETENAARLAFLPDGKLAAGTLHGQAMLFDGDGKTLWSHSVSRFVEPDEVERRWAELEALPTMQQSGSEPWWELIKARVGFKPDIAELSGSVISGTPLTRSFAGVPFGTYLVEWRHRRTKGSPALTLDISESEKTKPGEKPVVEGRVNLSARPQDSEFVERALLRLGDRPEKIIVTVQCSGTDANAVSSVSVLPLAFPSEDLIRIPSLYRDRINEESRANPPAVMEMFINVAEEGSPFMTRWADAYALINGRMLQKEPGLLAGKWFGAGNAFMPDTFENVPCWIDITLPQKKVITHVVIAEDPSLQRAETITIDAFIESRENRKGLSEYEKRQAARGFWYNAVKVRGNTNAYNVYKLDKPIFTRRLRVYVLGGHTSIDEIELYGALPQKKEASEK